MKKDIPILFASLIPLITGCNKLCKERELTIKRHDYPGTQLRTDGYYFGADPKDTNGSAELLFLYRNGVYSYRFSIPLADAQNGVLGQNELDNSVYSGTKRSWGAFRITGNLIEMESWQPTYTGCTNTYRQKGEIWNDTTFTISHIEYLRKKGKISETKEADYVYRFHAFSQKPDSTNNYVK